MVASYLRIAPAQPPNPLNQRRGLIVLQVAQPLFMRVYCRHSNNRRVVVYAAKSTHLSYIACACIHVCVYIHLRRQGKGASDPSALLGYVRGDGPVVPSLVKG